MELGELQSHTDLLPFSFLCLGHGKAGGGLFGLVSSAVPSPKERACSGREEGGILQCAAQLCQEELNNFCLGDS